MSIDPQDPKIMKRFLDQTQNKAKRSYEHGRLGPDDEGVLAMRIAVDPAHKHVILDFGKEVTWVAMSQVELEGFMQLLQVKLEQLKALDNPPPTII